jgi:hypothetical protein
MAHRFIIVFLISTFAFIAPILSVNAYVEGSQRSSTIDNLQSKILIARHSVCIKVWKGICIQ